MLIGFINSFILSNEVVIWSVKAGIINSSVFEPRLLPFAVTCATTDADKIQFEALIGSRQMVYFTAILCSLIVCDVNFTLSTFHIDSMHSDLWADCDVNTSFTSLRDTCRGKRQESYSIWWYLLLQETSIGLTKVLMLLRWPDSTDCSATSSFPKAWTSLVR